MASGILNVNKPIGPTSFGVVRRIKRLPGVVKVGHGGTLDPAAEGVLPVLVNAATRLADFIHAWPKTYLATVRFGAVSDTGDAEGTITPVAGGAQVTQGRLEAVLPSFTGWIDQVPPAYSAVKLGGEALYRKARRGEAVEARSRRVEIRSLRLLEYDQPRSAARLQIDCGSGTYVRSLARDLGVALGTGAYLGSLTRLRVGPLELDTAISPDRLVEMGEEWVKALLPMDLPLRAWPSVTLDAPGVAALRQGRAVAAPPLATGRYRMVDAEGRLIAWAEVHDGRLQPRAVFTP